MKLNLSGALKVRHDGREVEILANGNSEQLLAELKAHQPEELRTEALTLEEIFVASDILKKGAA
jgi:acylphosphatase